jgi:hypothetical protein
MDSDRTMDDLFEKLRDYVEARMTHLEQSLSTAMSSKMEEMLFAMMQFVDKRRSGPDFPPDDPNAPAVEMLPGLELGTLSSPQRHKVTEKPTISVEKQEKATNVFMQEIRAPLLEIMERLDDPREFSRQRAIDFALELAMKVDVEHVLDEPEVLSIFKRKIRNFVHNYPRKRRRADRQRLLMEAAESKRQKRMED